MEFYVLLGMFVVCCSFIAWIAYDIGYDRGYEAGDRRKV